MVSIIDKIKEIRERNNFSQDYVASKLSMTQQAYQKIENGTTSLKLEIILNLAKLYKVGSHEFIGNVDSELQQIFDKKEIEQLKLENENLIKIVLELRNQLMTKQ